jgi:ABC-type dipeptide/oligopeptide/nickel transport system ATPase subunit
MNAHVRKFESRPAVRESVPLLVGLMGPSGGGKTYSALRLATGIQTVTGGDVYVIDTESRRALHYADDFKFRHIQFEAPFGSLDYLAAMQQCVQAGAKVIVIDSMTHEHAGPGGYLLTQEDELGRMAGEDYAKRERVKFAAWIKPAKLRQQMIGGILQLNANFVFCFRAKEKTKPMKNDRGKIEAQELGFMPIAGEELLFEMTVNCLLLPKAGGVPSWRSDHIGEKLMMKLPRQFEPLFAEQKPIDESIGRALAEWAKGGKAPPARQPQSAESEQPPTPDDGLPDFLRRAPPPPQTQGREQLHAMAREAAERGRDVFSTFWGGRSTSERAIIQEIGLELRATLDRKPAAVAP